MLVGRWLICGVVGCGVDLEERIKTPKQNIPFGKKLFIMVKIDDKNDEGFDEKTRCKNDEGFHEKNDEEYEAKNTHTISPCNI